MLTSLSGGFGSVRRQSEGVGVEPQMEATEGVIYEFKSSVCWYSPESRIMLHRKTLEMTFYLNPVDNVTKENKYNLSYGNNALQKLSSQKQEENGEILFKRNKMISQ